MLDPNNPIVKLCAEGMEHEGQGDVVGATQSFVAAWNQATTNCERCIAAHYVARHQQNPADELAWNLLALDHAKAAADDQVRELYPSLYLNIGKAYENVGNREEAKRSYELAAGAVDLLPEGAYGTFTRNAIRRARIRVS
jgi:tetratricopeptide (TPR) repeat protein